MDNKGYFRIPRSLTRRSLWIDLPPAYRDVFYVILDHVCFKPYEFDDHGEIVILEPGQFCASIREIVNLCGKFGDKNIVERAIAKFERYGIMRKEVRHTRMILTITHIDTYDLIKKATETESETTLRQLRDNFETQKKNEKNEKNEKEEITHGQMAVGCDVIHFDFLENKVVPEKPKYNVYATSPYQATYAYSQRPYQKSTYQKPDKKQSYGKEDNVYFTEKEYDDLLAEGNMTNIERDYWIDQIRLEIGKQGEKEFNRRYKSHYHTILSWKKLREEKTKMVSSPKKTPLNQDNKEYAEKVESNYYSPYWKIVVLSKGIEFCPRSGNIEPKVINYSENGFKEQVESELRKKNFINKSKS